MIHLTLNLTKTLADAQATTPDGTYQTGLPTVQASSTSLQPILQILFGIIGALALLFIVIAALQFITSGGDPQNVAKARQTILYAVIGLVVAVLAEVIVTFVLNNA